MKIALAILNQLRRSPSVATDDRFEVRLRTMTSPAMTGPRLRRVMPPVLFRARRGAAA